MLCYIMLCYIIVSFHIIVLYYIILYCIVLYCIILYYIMLYYVVHCYIRLGPAGSRLVLPSMNSYQTAGFSRDNLTREIGLAKDRIK